MNHGHSSLLIVAGNDMQFVAGRLPTAPSQLLRPAIVHLGFTDSDLAIVESRVAGSRKAQLIDADAISRSTLDRIPRVAVDIDAIAPRLREVRLPSSVVDADYVAAIVNDRGNGSVRPDLVLGLWAKIVPFRQRLAARLTGLRDGLTTELLLARLPDQCIVLEQAPPSAQVIAVSGNDPIATEVMALAIRDVRSSSISGAPAPWEDPLVQRATELDLGASGPSEITVTIALDDRFSAGQRRQAADLLRRVADRAGIAVTNWT